MEVGCFALDGFSSVPASLGVKNTLRFAFMQCGGRGLRIEIGPLRGAMEDNRPLLDLLMRYTHVFLIQVATTALADGRYRI